jgi:hypothetical protein
MPAMPLSKLQQLLDDLSLKRSHHLPSLRLFLWDIDEVTQENESLTDTIGFRASFRNRLSNEFQVIARRLSKAIDALHRTGRWLSMYPTQERSSESFTSPDEIEVALKPMIHDESVISGARSSRVSKIHTQQDSFRTIFTIKQIIDTLHQINRPFSYTLWSLSCHFASTKNVLTHRYRLLLEHVHRASFFPHLRNRSFSPPL